MEQLIITAPSKRVADQIRQFVATLEGVSVGAVIFDRPKGRKQPASEALITKEQLVANIAAGLQEIREIEAGKRQSVSFQDFMMDAGTDED